VSLAAGPSSLLLGAASLDIYLGRDLVLPGGGVLNMAWHLRDAADPWHLLTRVGDDRPGVFLEFLGRHGIAHSAASIVGRGASASIDIEIQPDLQPHMDNFVEGVWATYRSTPDEERLIAGARRLHLVLVEGAIRELDRLWAAGLPAGLDVSADFLGFRHYTVDRFAATMRAVEVGFVGWPGALDDPVVGGIRDVAHGLGRLVVVTLGSRGVRVFDGRSGGEDRFLPVRAVPVAGTTVGCGDAFVAAFLASWRRSPDVLAAVEAGKAAGAEATAWRRPLPDEAYGPEAVSALRAADEAAVLGG
jgi:sugar/nucleoside kinase (ribokinase family)